MIPLVKSLAAAAVVAIILLAAISFPAGRKFMTYVLWLLVLVSIGVNYQAIISLLGGATWGPSLAANPPTTAPAAG